MDTGRTPACVALPFDEDNTSVLNALQQGDNSKQNKTTQPRIAGNRCGHHKNNIRVSPLYGALSSRKRSPNVIEECGRRLLYLARYFHRGIPEEAREILRNQQTDMFRWFCSLREDEKFLRFIYHISQGSHSRKRRSESLEATLFLVLGTLIFRCELHEMAYGYYDGTNNFHNFDHSKLGKDTMESDSRIKRAMKVLKDMDLIKVTPKLKTLPNGKIITEHTRIELSEDVFKMLGVYDIFLKGREDAAKRFHEKQSRIDKNRLKKEPYRKPFFSRKPNQRPSNGLQSLATAITKRITAPIKGNGEAIRDKMLELRNRGVSASDAMEIVRKLFYPSPPDRQN